MTDRITEALASPDWTAGEKAIIKWQFGLFGDFRNHLFAAICRADEDNLNKLALGFPSEVAGLRAWRYGDLGDRLRKAGLPV